MSSRINLYPGGISTPSTSPYGGVADTGGISLRDELDSILTGAGGEVPKGIPLIIRKMRTDSNGDLVTCTNCVDQIYNSPDRTYTCPYCYGVGHLWDEELVTGYKQTVVSNRSGVEPSMHKEEFGNVRVPTVKFYLPHTAEITQNDVIVEIELDIEGDPTIPYNRIGTYEIMLLQTLRGDYGRVEYFICNTQLRS